MIEISSLFQFNSFVNNDHYLVSLFTPICMLARSLGGSTKKNLPLPPCLALSFSSMRMVVRDHLC